MTTPPTTFQTAVNRSTTDCQRHRAIDRLAAAGDTDSLRLLVMTDGLEGEFRRRALKRLLEQDDRSPLEKLAEEATLDPRLRRNVRAEVCRRD